jgi:hypothetical protein
MAGAAPAAYGVPALVAVQAGRNARILAVEPEPGKIIDALKIDMEGFEEVVLHPFFQDTNARLWPRLVIMEHARGSRKTDLISMRLAKGYSTIARSKLNVVVRRGPLGAAANAGPL